MKEFIDKYFQEQDILQECLLLEYKDDIPYLFKEDLKFALKPLKFPNHQNTRQFIKHCWLGRIEKHK